MDSVTFILIASRGSLFTSFTGIDQALMGMENGEVLKIFGIVDIHLK